MRGLTGFSARKSPLWFPPKTTCWNVHVGRVCSPGTSLPSADILHLDYPDESFDKVIAANVIHLLDEPLKALSELDRVCRKGGSIIIPTYMNRISRAHLLDGCGQGPFRVGPPVR